MGLSLVQRSPISILIRLQNLRCEAATILRSTVEPLMTKAYCLHVYGTKRLCVYVCVCVCVRARTVKVHLQPFHVQ
jgi:hypothetical protein